MNLKLKLFILILLTNLKLIHGQSNASQPTTPNLNPFASHSWARDYRTDRNILAFWLLNGCSEETTNCAGSSRNVGHLEYEGYDGWYNNLARPDSGAIDRPLLRRSPAAYEDGSYKPSGHDRPNPMELSENLLKLDRVGTKSQNGRSAFLVFFGQQLVEEILDAQRAACPPEYFNIEIPENHRLRNETNHTILPFLRTRYDMRTGFSPNNPRQQLNEITPYFDGGLFYGTSKAWADYLRTNEDGELEPDGLLAKAKGYRSSNSMRREPGTFPAFNKERLPMANPPPPVNHSAFIEQHEILKVERFFKLGNPRGNENTFLLTFGILWFRWHNYLARNLKTLNPTWSGEKIFNEARKWVIATHQHIVVNTWLPIWLGESLPEYSGYDPSIDPQIDQFFQAVAMRFGHTLVVPGVYLRDYGRNGCSTNFTAWPHRAVRTCNSFWRPQDAILRVINDENNEIMDIDRLIMGMASQPCEQEDHKIVEDLRGNVFGPLEFSRRDLMAINIQRARDHGLPDYNTARKIFGLPPITYYNIDTHFSHVDSSIRNELRRIYGLNSGRMNVIDPWVGGILETTSSGPGELFRAIIKDQFRRIRDGDRFWFENQANELFTRAEIERIRNLNIYDIVMAVTNLDSNDIPKNPFRVFPNTNSELPQRCRNIINETTVSGNETYRHLPALTPELLQESCTTAGTYDYFYNSELSYILTFSFVTTFLIGTITIVILLTKKQEKDKLNSNKSMQKMVNESFRASRRKDNITTYIVKEWVGPKESLRPVVIILNKEKGQIEVNTLKGSIIRVVDFSVATKSLDLYLINDGLHLLIRKKNEYDLVLKFESTYLRDNFLQTFEMFIQELGITRERINMALKPMYKQAVTKKDRQEQLNTFFRVVFAQAFDIRHSRNEMLNVDSKLAEKIIHTEITITEFADTLSMKHDSEFVKRMFHLMDKNQNGFISFREFLDLLCIFSKGTPKEKAKVLFDMYDINKTEFLTPNDFETMITSLMENCGIELNSEDLQKTIQTIQEDLAKYNKNGVSFEDFYNIFKGDIEKIGNVGIDFSKEKTGYLKEAYDTVESLYDDPRELQRRIQGETSTESPDNKIESLIDDEQEEELNKIKIQISKSDTYKISRTIETYLREIFWMLLFTFVTIAIFAERAYYYSVEREHSGLRRIAGYGVTITRGAASGQMFTYSVLLLTMCRNLITKLRETFLNYYIPFDRSLEMHKYIAVWALFFTLLHIIGHAFNFYSISTQTADDLTCLFRNYFHATHELPKFHYWCWQTMTGFCGIMVTLIGIIIFVCAIPGISRNIFWFGHKFYPLFYLFMFLHGTGRLIQEPYFPYFFVGPFFLFVFDSAISARRKKVEIRVLNAELLPSGVTKLEFKRPNNFEYKSGQWVRIACLELNASEFHPFTLSSSPDEENLTIHIRSVGPWTNAIRQVYDTTVLRTSPLPKIHLDGPYGEGHQDWYRFEVSVLIGGGIGVTPFASILKDIVFHVNKVHRSQCKKVYFIWVTRTQKQFEWLVDIIRDLENTDSTKTVSTHLFITQFYNKFDLRTTLLYLCERHFQRVSGGRSLFTGLKAITHFGRPKFPQFFKSLQTLHPNVSNFGIFTCGPLPMISTVDKACLQINKLGSGSDFVHHYKAF